MLLAKLRSQLAMRRAAAFALVLTALWSSAPVWAGPPAGVQIVKHNWDPAKPDQPGKTVTVLDKPNLLGDVVEQGWTGAKGRLEQGLMKILGKGDLIAKGITLYDIKIGLAASPELQLDTSGNPIKLTVALKGNSIEATSTTPTALGKYADPRFSITFDVTVQLELAVPTVTQPLHMKHAIATISNVSKPDSHNFAADVISVVDTIVGFFGGPDFLKLAAESANGRSFDFTNEINNGVASVLPFLPQLPQGLKPMNKVLKDAAGQGYRLMDGLFDTKSNKLILAVTRIPATPTKGKGVIAGIIRWKKAYGHPQLPKLDAYSHALKISAAVQTAPKDGQSFDGPTKNIGRVQTHMQVTGDNNECHYTIHDLPIGVPIRVDVALQAKYGWVAGSEKRSGYDDRYFRQVGGGGPVYAHRADLARINPALQASQLHASLAKFHPSAKLIPSLKEAVRPEAPHKSSLPKTVHWSLPPKPRGVDFEMYLQDPLK